jgi:hypothetical protein
MRHSLSLILAFLLVFSFVTSSAQACMSSEPAAVMTGMLHNGHDGHDMSGTDGMPSPSLKHDCVSCLGCACNHLSVALRSAPIFFTLQERQFLAMSNPLGRIPALEPQPPRPLL